MAHDVRSPLTTVGLALGIAKRSAQIDPKTQTVLDQGVSTLQRVGQLVDGLLLVARAGGPPPEGEVRASVDKVVQEVVEEMRPTAAAAGIEIDFVAMAPSIVACNPGVLTSIVSNLLGNAIKYMGDAKERRVTVRIRDLDTNVRIEVQDTGPGLAPELQDRIFEPYVRGRASGAQGFGLGLATVRRLAEAHGGAAGLDKNVPVGSLFWVELPKATARKASLTAHS